MPPRRSGSNIINFGRNLSWQPERLVTPRNETELAEIVQRSRSANTTIKAVGAAHSFTPLATTDAVQVSLELMRNPTVVDVEAGTVRVGGGARIGEINRALGAAHLALANQGDIDRQSIAGAVATGTHGTGIGFGSLSSMIESMTLVDGTGRVRHFDSHTEKQVWNSLCLGLGVLGIVTELTLKVTPAFRLHSVDRVEAWSRAVPDFTARCFDHDHFEMFWLPGARMVQTRAKDRIGHDPRNRGRLKRLRNDWVYENLLFAIIRQVYRARPSTGRRITRLLEAAMSQHDYIDWSPRVFTSIRRVPFLETEFAVPLSVVPEILEGIRRIVEDLDLNPVMPIEVRSSAGDETHLSPTQNHRTGWIAVHQFTEDKVYFDRVWELAASYGARPHWGKMHPFGVAELTGLYPRLGIFNEVRGRFDPDGVFSSPYIDGLLGTPGTRQ